MRKMDTQYTYKEKIRREREIERKRGASEHELQLKMIKHTSGLLGGNCCMIVCRVELSVLDYSVFQFNSF